MIATLISIYWNGFTRKLDKLFKLGKNKDPYMRYKEIDFFLELLDALKPQRILEYGCGHSTNFFTQKLPSDIEWMSLEHNEEWYEKMRLELDGKPNISLHHVKPDAESWVSGGTYADFKTYVDYPENYGKFDLILIDGVARNACMQKAFDLLNDKGVVITHDINRVKYHEDIMKYPNWLIIEDYRRHAGGFGVASKQLEVNTLVNLEKQEKIWKIDNFLGNLSRLYFLIGKPSKPFRLRGSAL